MALQRLWSKDFYDRIDEDLRPKVRVTAVAGFIALFTVLVFGVLYYTTGRVLQLWSMPITFVLYAGSMVLLALRKFDIGRVALSVSTTLGTTSLALATGPDFGGWIFLMVISPLALLVFRLEEKFYFIPIIILGFLSLAVSFYFPGRVDMGGWYQPYDAEFNSTMLVANVLEAAVILLVCFYMIVNDNRKRIAQEAAAKRVAKARQQELAENAKELELAIEQSQLAEQKANETALELMSNKSELMETVELMKEREREIAQKNEDLQASEEELRQNLEELETTQEQMKAAEQQLLLKNEIFKQSVVPIAAGTNVLKEFNRAFYHDLLGYDDDTALLGTRLRELAPERQPNGRKTVDVAQELAKTLEDQPEMSFEWLFRRKDGSTVLAEVTLSPLNVQQDDFEGGIMLMARDITERKQQEEQLRTQNRIIQRNEQRMSETVRELEAARESERFLTQFNDLLRFRENDELDTWADRLIESLAPELGALQVTFYVRDYENEGDDDDNRKVIPRLKYLTGYAQPEECPEYIDWGEGLMGQVARTGRPFEYRQNGSRKSRKIGRVQSGMLAMRMSYARVQPITYNQEVVGTLEFTAFKKLNKQQTQLLEEATQRIGAALATLRNQFRVRSLYEEAQKNAQRLQQQELELRQNIDQLNTAQEEMKRAQNDVSKLNDELEERVQSRTAELEQAMQKVESTQSQLIMSEKMAALGQLVAGIAHEINSPLGAIKASSSTMQDILPNTITDMPRVLLGLNPDQLDMFTRIVQHLLEGDPQNLTSKEERQLRKDYQKQLEDEGVDKARKIAKDIVGAGFQGDLTPYLPLLKAEEAKEVTDLLYYLGQLNVNLANINLAADKTKKTVFALKSYAHRSDQDELTPSDLKQNVETVLTIYHNQIKYGIDLDTNLKEVPPVMVNPDEISQVWTNLIQNAIQAMNSEGDMLVETYRDGDYVVVAVEDKGPGIPPDIQDKIFQPFFTTKKKGEGTGLGLDICKKIVEKFDGELTFTSEPGRTRFETRLPVATEEQLKNAEPATPEAIN